LGNSTIIDEKSKRNHEEKVLQEKTKLSGVETRDNMWLEGKNIQLK